METRCVRAQVSKIWSEVGFDVGGGVAGGVGVESCYNCHHGTTVDITAGGLTDAQPGYTCISHPTTAGI